ncbi:MAG: hypothetical protein HOA71_03425 [Nitrospina sp.]|jgi:hypothetical protein|nr:hypothetical protein [Nitrospina sp.]MBT7707371.1 hypothetical protein [Nitrospina sp.]
MTKRYSYRNEELLEQDAQIAKDLCAIAQESHEIDLTVARIQKIDLKNITTGSNFSKERERVQKWRHGIKSDPSFDTAKKC